MSSQRQILANRRNAAKSTGPRTAAGKASTRRNALKHGFAGRGVVLPEQEQEALIERIQQWASALKPDSPYEHYLHEVVCLESLRFQRCVQHQTALSDEQVQRARESWDEDRRILVEEEALGLAAAPALISRKLETSLQGVEWKLERWEHLAEALETRGVWSDAEQARVYDLLGIPAEERVPDSSDDREVRQGLVAVERERLGQLLGLLADRDARLRGDAEDGLAEEPSQPLQLAQKYERAIQRHLRWAVGQLQKRRGTTRAGGSPAVRALLEAMFPSLRDNPENAAQPSPPYHPVHAPSSVPSPAPAPIPRLDPVLTPSETLYLDARQRTLASILDGPPPTHLLGDARGLSAARPNEPNENLEGSRRLSRQERRKRRKNARPPGK